jgi:hypothetical protein
MATVFILGHVSVPTQQVEQQLLFGFDQDCRAFQQGFEYMRGNWVGGPGKCFVNGQGEEARV